MYRLDRFSSREEVTPYLPNVYRTRYGGAVSAPTHRSATVGLVVRPIPPEWGRARSLGEESALTHRRLMAKARGEPDPLLPEWIPFGRNHQVPRRFVAQLNGDDPRYPTAKLDIEFIDGRFACTRVEVQPRREDGDEIRLPLAKFVREAVALAAAGALDHASPLERTREFHEVITEQRRNAIPRDQIVALCRDADGLGLPREPMLQKTFPQIPAMTVRRWYRTCRREGRVGPSPRRS
jgi:hypothetical protein